MYIFNKKYGMSCKIYNTTHSFRNMNLSFRRKIKKQVIFVKKKMNNDRNAVWSLLLVTSLL